MAKAKLTGRATPLGEIGGEPILRKIWIGKVKPSAKVAEFLAFCEALNRGQA